MKKQRAKVGGSGSFINQLMSNNSTEPVVGKGATTISYSDRTCYEVLSVGKDGKSAVLEMLEAKHDPQKPSEMGHQNWFLKPTGQTRQIVWRYGAWYFKSKTVVFTKAYITKYPEQWLFRTLTKEQQIEIYGDNPYPSKVVEGITEYKFRYSKVNIIFGVKDYYYDWSF